MKTFLRLVVAFLTLLGVAAANELAVRPDRAGQPGIEGTYRLGQPVSGKGSLALVWRDALGRLVERRNVKFTLSHGSSVNFRLDRRRAVTVSNNLNAHLVFDARGINGRVAHLERDSSAMFTVLPPAGAWSDFQIIMWQEQSPSQYAALSALGISAGMVETIHDARNLPDAKQVARLLQANLPWYVENIATDFYSPYHRWSDGRPVNWQFTALKDRLLQDPSDRSVFIREPSLSDPTWLTRIRDRLIRSVALQKAYGPLYYNLGDEPGIAETAAFWDFDLSAPSLRALRAWLRQRYGTLSALNAEWGTNFQQWSKVEPLLTRDAMRRGDGNFSAWADFKEGMDVAFARAMRAGTDAVHAADPTAIAAFEGGQIPGWGGYDYARLSGAVDAMEIYDYGNNIDIVHALDPRTILLTTSFSGGPAEEHRVWRQLLRGARGMVLWDEKQEFVTADGAIGPRGQEAKDYFSEIRDGVGALLINSTSERDPIAILYSPASFRVQWMLDHQAEGDAWMKRDAGAEYEDDAPRVALRDYAAAIARLGFEPDYISSTDIARGKLRTGGLRVLILPGTIALSAAESREVRDFVEHGRTAIAVGMPGLFDEHGKRLARPSLAGLFAGASPTALGSKGRAVYLPPAIADVRGSLAPILAAARVMPSVVTRGATGAATDDVVPYRFRNGSFDILALLRDLAPPAPGERVGQPKDGPEHIVLTLPRARFVYDLRQHKLLGRMARIEIDLASTSPTLLALSDEEPRPPDFELPRTLRLGDLGALRVRGLAAPATVLHVDLIDPSGRIDRRYSGNLIAHGRTAEKFLPLALDDPAGDWTVKVTNLLGGPTMSLPLRVLSPMP